jgi:hypothetical protein
MLNIKYILMFRHQTAGQGHYIKRANKSFSNVAMFRYYGTMVTDQNCIHEEIKSRLNLGNACNHQFRIFSSGLLFKSVKIKIYKTIILRRWLSSGL